MKVEEFANQVIKEVADHQCVLQDHWATLDRMRQSENMKHVKNYWKVCQAVAELSMGLLVRRVTRSPIHLRFSAVHMLCYVTCTTAVVRRLLRHRKVLFQKL